MQERLPRRVSFQADLGEIEEAIASLDQAAEKGDWWLFSIKYGRAFDPIRGDARFKEPLTNLTHPQ